MNLVNRTLLGLLTASLAASAASAEKANPLTNLDARTFAFINVPEPDNFRVENSIFMLGGLAQRIRNNALSTNFSNDIKPYDPKFQGYLRKKLTQYLIAAGLEELPSPAAFVKRDEPENVDYKSVVTQADLLFNVYITDMGVYSSTRRSTYEPTVLVTFCVVAKQLGPKCAIEQEVKFGDNTTKEIPFEHVVPDEFHWKSADSLFQNVPGVITSVKLGLSIAAKEIAMNTVSKDQQVKIAPMETFAISEVVTDASVVRKDAALETENTAKLSSISKKSSTADGVDVAKKLRDLKALRDENVITEEEFQAKRKALVEAL